MPSTSNLIMAVALSFVTAGCIPGQSKIADPASGAYADLSICGARQPNTSDKTCIVDGDTLWLSGTNIRLKDFDTPESRTGVCGSFREIDLANAATARLQELLDGNAWTIETFGIDGTGQRRLATIRIEGEDVGDILIREGLARRWPDGDAFWC